MFSGLYTIVRTTPVDSLRFPMGVLPCLLFQGETYEALSRILHNYVVHCPVGSAPVSSESLQEAVHYVEACFGFDEFRSASQLGLALFRGTMKQVSRLSETARLALVADIHLEETDLYIPVSRCSTVGDFLAICFNFYLADLLDGRLAFEAIAALNSGLATDWERRNFRVFQENTMHYPAFETKLEFDPSLNALVPVYRVMSFRSYMALEYMQMSGKNVKYRRCSNPACQKYFVAKRSTAQFCGFPAPQVNAKGRSCKEYYPQFTNQLKTNQDTMLKKIRSTQCRLYNTSRRHQDKSLAVDALLSEIRENKDNKMEQVVAGQLTVAEFSAWLDSLRVK